MNASSVKFTSAWGKWNGHHYLYFKYSAFYQNQNVFCTMFFKKKSKENPSIYFLIILANVCIASDDGVHTTCVNTVEHATYIVTIMAVEQPRQEVFLKVTQSILWLDCNSGL